jgi:hypothetical protein
LAEDVDELAVELRARTARIRTVEDRLAVARQEPAQRAALAAELEQSALAWLGRIRDALLASPEGAREAYQALFPTGLRFSPSVPENGNRRVWVAEGLPELAGSNCDGDPTGDRTAVALPEMVHELRRAA